MTTHTCIPAMAVLGHRAMGPTRLRCLLPVVGIPFVGGAPDHFSSAHLFPECAASTILFCGGKHY